MEKLISIIMSTYNETNQQLEECISSIVNQTYKNLEIIIVNDNPTNSDLKNILNKYNCIDKRIKIIENDFNIGLVASLNKAIEMSNGYYLARMDADDICLPNRIADEVEFLEKHNLDIVSTRVTYIDENGNELKKQDNCFLSFDISPLLKYRNVVFHSTVLMKSTIIEHVGCYYNIPTAEDYELWVRIVKAKFKFGMIPKKTIYYRLRSNSISRQNMYKQYLTSKYISKQCFRTNRQFNELDLSNYLNQNRYTSEREIKRYTRMMSYYTKIFKLYNDKRYIFCIIFFVYATIKDFRILGIVIESFYLKRLIAKMR